ncbi:hypothetical protein DM02DRAFT_666808 [Periconia macrospinosa]|uniref:Homeobox domain-containing protein n=1 Tax=Periconia macrospinosa TaxID=97972 RepID=A0A2V1EDY7_9PLEO|nr:hypothetical protein DM02DRAFT_666808 [Periconia macrospinosa]
MKPHNSITTNMSCKERPRFHHGPHFTGDNIYPLDRMELQDEDNTTAVNLLHHSSKVLFTDRLWPELAAGNALDESQVQFSPSPFLQASDFTPHPHLPLLPSFHSARPTDADKRGSRRRIPSVARRILEDSFVRHSDHPYIPPDELQEIVKLTGLTTRQVRTFFANARARKLPPISNSSKSEAPTTAGPFIDDQLSVPLDRYLSSSSGQEGVDEDAVHEAAKRLRRPLPERRHRMSNTALSASGSNADSSSSSAGDKDNNPTPSYDSIHHRESRRGRRRRRDPAKKQITSVARKPSSPSRKFQCTFCTNDFAQKYDWRRHEESVHFPQKEWVCMPDGPVHEESCCVFCDLRSPDKRHLDSHKSITCSQLPRAKRAFLRRDKLIQHIKQVHACQPPKMMKSWCRPINHNVLLICGLCVCVLPDWGTRADHMVDHFTDNIGMDMWLWERPGGVVTSDVLPEGNILRGLSQHYSPYPHPEGTHKCEVCSDAFRFMSNLIVHRRQVHNIFRTTDLNKKYWPTSTTIDATGGAEASQPTNMNLVQIEEQQSHEEEETDYSTTNTTLNTIINTNPFFTNPQNAMISTPLNITTTTTLTTYIPHPSSIPFPHITTTTQRNPALTFTPVPSNAYPTSHHDVFYSTASFTPPSLSPSPLIDPRLFMTDEERDRVQGLRDDEEGFFGDSMSGVMEGLELLQEEYGGGFVGRWGSPFYDGEFL